MNEHPILFSSEMVRAILEGRKTQTRRVIKPQPYWEVGRDIMQYPLDCPYGQPGDRLWVRETWASHPQLNKVKPKHLNCAEIYYRATCDNDSHYSWRPSIHMPRWASRITLEVTGVRVERVRDITAEDAVKEGWQEDCGWDNFTNGQVFRSDTPVSVIDFAYLWDSINAKRGHSWESNPWVFVVEFKVVQP